MLTVNLHRCLANAMPLPTALLAHAGSGWNLPLAEGSSRRSADAATAEITYDYRPTWGERVSVRDHLCDLVVTHMSHGDPGRWTTSWLILHGHIWREPAATGSSSRPDRHFCRVDEPFAPRCPLLDPHPQAVDEVECHVDQQPSAPQAGPGDQE